MTCKTVPFALPHSVTEQRREDEMYGGLLLPPLIEPLGTTEPLSDMPLARRLGLAESAFLGEWKPDYTGRTAKGRARRS